MSPARHRPAALLAATLSLAALVTFTGAADAAQGAARKAAKAQRPMHTTTEGARSAPDKPQGIMSPRDAASGLPTGQVDNNPGAPKPVIGDILEGTNIRQQQPGQAANNPGAPKPIIGDILQGTDIRQQQPGQVANNPGAPKPVVGDILEGTNIRRKDVNVPTVAEGLPGR